MIWIITKNTSFTLSLLTFNSIRDGHQLWEEGFHHQFVLDKPTSFSIAMKDIKCFVSLSDILQILMCVCRKFHTSRYYILKNPSLNAGSKLRAAYVAETISCRTLFITKLTIIKLRKVSERQKRPKLHSRNWLRIAASWLSVTF